MKINFLNIISDKEEFYNNRLFTNQIESNLLKNELIEQNAKLNYCVEITDSNYIYLVLKNYNIDIIENLQLKLLFNLKK